MVSTTSMSTVNKWSTSAANRSDGLDELDETGPLIWPDVKQQIQ
jgi:hypothetical protein